MKQNFRPKTSFKPVQSSRSLALDALEAVLLQRKTLDEAFESSPAFSKLSAKDQAFAFRMVIEVLRSRRSLERVLGSLLASPIKDSQRRVHFSILLGIAQLCLLDTPPHAAVNETVSVIANSKFAPLKGLVNAVLQRVSRELSLYRKTLAQSGLDLPEWFEARWKHTYGDAFCGDAGVLFRKKPPIDFTIPKDIETWEKSLEGVRIAAHTVRVERDIQVDQLYGYVQGKWWVQDVASTLAASLFGDVRGKHVVDLCAAPGGKTAQLIAAGAEVTAVDISARRMQRLSQNLERLHMQARAMVSDVRRWRPDSAVDGVLLDAPCSATGTFRKNPEVLWIRNQTDIAEMASMQRQCLEAVLAWLPSGVPLVYTVCSLETEEGEAQIAALLRDFPDMMRVPVSGVDPVFEACITPLGDMRVLPTHLQKQGGNEGFYMAKLAKR